MRLIPQKSPPKNAAYSITRIPRATFSLVYFYSLFYLWQPLKNEYYRMPTPFHIDTDIRKAKTIHTDFYTKNEFYEAAKEKIFAVTWQFVTAKMNLEAQNVQPFTLLEGYIVFARKPLKKCKIVNFEKFSFAFCGAKKKETV